MRSGITHHGGRIELAGDLTAASVPALFAQTPKFSAGARRVDLRAVGEVDSAGLALLLHWSNLAAASSSDGLGGGKLTFTGAPAQLREMAKIAGLEGLLDLAAGEE